jgi:hypothetical protein
MQVGPVQQIHYRQQGPPGSGYINPQEKASRAWPEPFLKQSCSTSWKEEKTGKGTLAFKSLHPMVSLAVGFLVRCTHANQAIRLSAFPADRRFR